MAVDAAAARIGVTPRAVLGLLVVVVIAVLVLGVRTVRAGARSVPEPVGPAVLTGDRATTLASSNAVSPARASPVSPTGTAPTQTPSTAARVVVHVVGQVRRPGVVRLAAGSRVQQAVAAAGGATGAADLARVNLARPVVDGEQVVVPRPGEPVSAAAPAAGGPSPGVGIPASPVDLNLAGLAELDTLPGVGPVLAQRILDWRTEHGRFTSVDELGEVSGIGDAVLGGLRDLVRV